MTMYVAQAIVTLSLYKYVITISPFSLKGQLRLITGQKESLKNLDFLLLCNKGHSCLPDRQTNCFMI